MWHLLQTLFDLVLPRKEHAHRTQNRTIHDFLMTPEKHDLLGSTITTLFSYKSDAVDDCIRALKYEHSDHAAQLLADMLAEYLHEEITSIRLFSQKKILLVPVPLHKTREKSRGFNQIAKVLELLPQEYTVGPLSYHEMHVLERTRETAQQTRLSRSERLSNVAGAFSLREGIDLTNAHVILIDDVVTTGATIVNAATPLKKAGAEVTLLAFARA